METKNAADGTALTSKTLIEFKAEAVSGKGIYIEGWANKAVVDRGQDLIPGTAWDVSEFKKNPIIFFNHDRDMPIGKAVAVQVTKEGLHIRVKLSNSKEAPMPYIRDLVKEGILKTFSVGFDPMDSEEKMENGTTVIHKAKLLETSVVTLPMNQDSTFEYDEKSLMHTADLACKTYDEAKSKVLKAKNTKGSGMACRFQEAIGAAQRGVYQFDKVAALAKLSEVSSLAPEMVTEILAGNVTPIPSPFLQAFSQVFMCNYAWLEEDSEWEHQRVGEESPGVAAIAPEDGEKAAALAFRTKALAILDDLIQSGTAGDEAVAQAIVKTKLVMPEITAGKIDYDILFAAADEKVKATKDAIATGVSDQADFGSPEITMLKAQLAHLGTLVTLMGEMVKEIRGVNSKMGDIFEIKSKDALTTAPEPALAPVVATPAEAAPQPPAEPVQLAARAARLDRMSKVIDTFEMTLATLKG
jgi:HK97 family phage prohead protease